MTATAYAPESTQGGQAATGRVARVIGPVVDVEFPRGTIPELFNAAIIQVPLFDMMRYHMMGAGASWIGEYGDPRIAEQRAWIVGYSPYQHLTPGRTYPMPFILTSTADDRVHPAHGRKAAARLQQLGQGYYYYENMEGGHAAAAWPPSIFS